MLKRQLLIFLSKTARHFLKHLENQPKAKPFL